MKLEGQFQAIYCCCIENCRIVIKKYWDFLQAYHTKPSLLQQIIFRSPEIERSFSIFKHIQELFPPPPRPPQKKNFFVILFLFFPKEVAITV